MDEVQNKFRILVRTAIFSFMTLLICSNCSGIVEQEKVVPVQQVQIPCEGGINQPVRRVVYAFSSSKFSFEYWKWLDPSPYGDKNFGILLLDTDDPNKGTSDESAILTQDNALLVDNYFTNLAHEGYGSWDGCYGAVSTERIMTTLVHYFPPPSETFKCGWQSGIPFTEVVLHNDCITPTAIAHEWTHGLVERTLGLKPDDIPSAKESSAIYESLGDIFAVIITSPDGPYTVNSTTGIVRNLADPVSIGQVNNLAEYLSGHDKYENSRIFSYAAYLLMDVTRAQGNSSGIGPGKYTVQPIGEDKVGRIFFHALSPAFVRHLTPDEHEFSGEYSFEEMAIGILTACQDLANPEGEQIIPLDHLGKGGITPFDCEQTKLAFCAVGILQELSCTSASGIVIPTPVVIVPTPTSETEPASSIIERIYDETYWSYVINHSSQTITIHNATCSKGESGYQIVWEDFDVPPNEDRRYELDTRYCPSVTYEIVPQEGESIPIQLVYNPDYTYRITVTDSDFR